MMNNERQCGKGQNIAYNDRAWRWFGIWKTSARNQSTILIN